MKKTNFQVLTSITYSVVAIFLIYFLTFFYQIMFTGGYESDYAIFANSSAISIIFITFFSWLTFQKHDTKKVFLLPLIAPLIVFVSFLLLMSPTSQGAFMFILLPYASILATIFSFLVIFMQYKTKDAKPTPKIRTICIITLFLLLILFFPLAFIFNLI